MRFVIDTGGLDALIRYLATSGYIVWGPVVESAAVRFKPIQTLDDVALGAGSRQEAGHYELTNAKGGVFGQGPGANSLKELLFPPRRQVWAAAIENGRVLFREPGDRAPAQAVIGARPCDLAAVRVQDRVFLDGPYIDPDYLARRERLFVVVADCTQHVATCFCTSFGAGPKAGGGYDLAVTEISSGPGSLLVGRIGSESGERTLRRVPHRPATPAEIQTADELPRRAAASMNKGIDPDSAPRMLARNLENPLWDEIAERCLACASCTLVCPTCFCTSTADDLSLDGRSASHSRRWDSCFSLDFSFMGGAPVRQSVASRYRQWLTHKLSSWVDQFGMIGCVGCGRCITWCPAGIDIREEVAALAEETR